MLGFNLVAEGVSAGRSRVHLAATARLLLRNSRASAILGGLALTFAAVAGLSTATANVAGVADPHYLACAGRVALPRTVRIGPGVDAGLVRASIAEWNRFYGDVFVEVTGRADVDVIADTATWVEMPCATPHAIVHAGGRTNLEYWMTHELGHTLGLADHLRQFDDAAQYVNPGRCPDDGYDGIMSYCTPRQRWFGADDLEMMHTLFPHVRTGVSESNDPEMD